CAATVSSGSLVAPCNGRRDGIRRPRRHGAALARIRHPADDVRAICVSTPFRHARVTLIYFLSTSTRRGRERVSLELPILALIPGLGNVAWPPARGLRCLACKTSCSPCSTSPS